MAVNSEHAVRRLNGASICDARLVAWLTELINDVYATAESGLWLDGAARTTTSEVAEMVANEEIAVDSATDGHIVGSVRIRMVSDDTSEFGMLVAAPDRRNAGIGRALLDFVERDARARGLRAIQLELLVPREWPHPNKEFLKAWYGRRGYRLIETRRMDDSHPHLAPLLATACDLEVYEKALHDSKDVAAADDGANLAAKLADSGPTGIDDQLARFVKSALLHGADPLLGSIVLDSSQPDVIRQRAFGKLHHQVAELAGTAHPSPSSESRRASAQAETAPEEISTGAPPTRSAGHAGVQRSAAGTRAR